MLANLKLLGLCLMSGLLIDQCATAQVQQTSYVSPANRTTPALRYFGRGRYSQAPQRQTQQRVAATRPVQPTHGKPFQEIDNRPSLSPYLGLDMVQTNEGIPNYYLRVLPQQQQRDAEQRQAAELRKLQQRARLAHAPGIVGGVRAGGVPTTGRSSQFMNDGGYFPTIRR